MERITFAPGRKVLVIGKEFTVTGISDNNEIHLRSKDGIERKVDLETLHDWYQSGNLKAADQIPSKRDRNSSEKIKTIRRNEFYSEKAKEQGLIVKAIVDATEEHGSKIDDKDPAFKRLIESLAKKFGIRAPSARTIYRWKSRAFIASGFEKFIPRWNCRGGKGVSRIHPEIQELMEKVVTNDYMTSFRKTIAACHALLRSKINELNELRPKTAQFNTPSRSTFERWIEANEHGYDIYATRNSKQAADQKYRTSTRNSENWEFMQCVEVDHTPLDVIVVDEENGTVLGRPRLTLMIEWKTRCCIGLTIGFEGTSTQVVLDCLKMAVKPKGEFRKKYPSLQNDWPCWGMPQYLKLDNGPEFHSLSFKVSLAELGINTIYCPRKKAWFKGRVERALKRINHELIATLPGATFTQLYNRVTGNDPSEYAVIDIKRLKEIVYTWVIDDYHQTYQKKIRATPHEAWNRLFDITKVALPGDLDLLEIMCTELKVRTLQHYGIEILTERTFNNSCLAEIRRRKQFDKTIRVKIRYNPQKLDRIWVYDEDEMNWIEVQNSNPETRDLSYFQLSMINQLRNAEHNESKGRLSIAAAKEKVKEIIKPLLASKRQRERRSALKMLGFEASLAEPSQSLLAKESKSSSVKASSRREPLPRAADESKDDSATIIIAKPRSQELPIKRITVDAIYEGEFEIFPVERVTVRRGGYGW